MIDQEQVIKEIQSHPWEIIFDANHVPMSFRETRFTDHRIANGLLYASDLRDQTLLAGLVYGGEIEINLDASVTGAEIRLWDASRPDWPGEYISIGSLIKITREGTISVQKMFTRENVELNFDKVPKPQAVKINAILICEFVYGTAMRDPEGFVHIYIDDELLTTYRDDSLLVGYVFLNGGIYSNIKYRGKKWREMLRPSVGLPPDV